MTGDSPTARTGWRQIGGSGLQQASRDNTKTTRMRFAAPRFGNQDGSGTGL